jgi:hypothetical protein
VGYDKLLFHERYKFVVVYLPVSIPAAARSKAWANGRSIAGIAGSNPAAGRQVLSLVNERIVR